MRAVLVLCLLAPALLAPAAFAQTPMSPDDFDTWSTGKTLDYSVDGRIIGSESYASDRQVRDADTGGPCLDGSWSASGDQVCFVYPARDGVHCWTYWREGDAVFAKPVTADPADPPQRVTVADAPLDCPGPDVGV